MVRQKPARNDSFLIFLKCKYLFDNDNRDIRKRAHGRCSYILKFQANALLLYALILKRYLSSDHFEQVSLVYFHSLHCCL